MLVSYLSRVVCNTLLSTTKCFSRSISLSMSEIVFYSRHILAIASISHSDPTVARRDYLIHHHHQAINPYSWGTGFTYRLHIRRTGHNPPRGPGWWVLTTANAAGTNGLTCLPKHGGDRDNKFLVTHPMPIHTETHKPRGHRAPLFF
jgi:hypothetical protein